MIIFILLINTRIEMLKRMHVYFIVPDNLSEDQKNLQLSTPPPRGGAMVRGRSSGDVIQDGGASTMVHVQSCNQIVLRTSDCGES